MRARMKNAGANLAIIRCMVLNLFRTDTSKRKAGIPTKRILAASSDSYREALLGLGGFDAIALLAAPLAECYARVTILMEAFALRVFATCSSTQKV